MNKKAALELSITAIVVLIIAITVLGLAIGFIKNLFGEGQKTITSQFESIKENLREEFISGGEVLGFDRGKDIKVDLGTREELYMGIRNTESDAQCFKADIKCLTAFEGGDCGGIAKGTSVVDAWFSTFPPEVDIEGNDFYLAPVKMHITAAPKDTYRLALELYKGSDCSTLGTIPIKTKLIHITVR